MLLVETVVRKGVARPEEGLLVVGVEELGIELHRCACAEDVVINNLKEADVASVRVEVESLGLDVGVIESLPFQVLFGQFGEGRVACILSDRMDGLGAIYGFLGTGNGG